MRSHADKAEQRLVRGATKPGRMRACQTAGKYLRSPFGLPCTESVTQQAKLHLVRGLAQKELVLGHC